MNLKALHEIADAEKSAKVSGKDPQVARLQVEMNKLKSRVDQLVLQVAESDNALRIYQKKMEMLMKKLNRGIKIQQADINDISITQQQQVKRSK